MIPFSTGTEVEGLSLLGVCRVWKSRPHDQLGQEPNGTLFLLKTGMGRIHLCELCGNLPDDESWKARRLSDFNIIRLENLQGAEFIKL